MYTEISMKEVAYEGAAFRREEFAWEERKRTYKRLRQPAPVFRVRTLHQDLERAQRTVLPPVPVKQERLWTLNHALFALAVVFALSIGIGAYALFSQSGIERPRSHKNELNYTATDAGTRRETETAAAKPRSETREAAALLVTGSSRTEIAADVAIIAGNTYLLSGNTRDIRTLKKEGGETTPLDAHEFLSTMTSKIPPSLLRAIDMRDHRFGLIMTEERLEGYLFLSIGAYPYAAGGMREWERSLATELLPILAPWRSKTAIEMTGARAFTDLHIGTVDTRTILDDAGKPLILYAFPNKEHLLITTSQEAFTMLVSTTTAK